MPRSSRFKFRLYLAGSTPNSALAEVNLAAFCRVHLSGRYEIEVVDVFREPQRAMTDGIFITPTLIKFAPSPVRMIVGNLSRTESVLDALGLAASRR
jgi:circadian clock protein KaiB